MRVIAIRDQIFNDIPGRVALHKGSIYHVINEVFDPKPKQFLDTGNIYPNGCWFYELLEQIGYHCEDAFLELPEDNLIEIKDEQNQFIIKEKCYN